MLQDYLMGRLLEGAAIGQKIQSSDSISQKGKFALDATEKNPNIEDSMAEKIANLENQTAGLKNSVKNIISLPNGASTGDGQIEDAKTGIEGEAYDTLGDAIREQIKTYRDVSVSNTQPTGKPKVWVNTAANDSEGQDILLPQINDDVVSPDDTWSSQKIDSELSQLSEENAELKGDIVNLDNALNNGKRTLILEWEKGAINPSGEVSDNSRLRTTDYIDLSNLDSWTIRIPSGYKVYVWYYQGSKNNYTYKEARGWLTSDTFIGKPNSVITACRLSMGRTNDSTDITPLEGKNISFEVDSIVSEISENVNNNSLKIEGLENYLDVKVSSKFLNCEAGTGKQETITVFENLYLKKGSYVIQCEQDKTLTSVTRNTFYYHSHGTTTDQVSESFAENNHLESGIHTWSIVIDSDGYYDFYYWVNNPSDSITLNNFRITKPYVNINVKCYRYLVPTFIDSDTKMILLGTDDLRTFDIVAKKGEAYSCSKKISESISNTLRDPSIIKIKDYYYFTYTIIAFNSGSNEIGMCRTKDFNKWEELDNLSIVGDTFGLPSSPFVKVWSPSWFRDGKDIYVISTCFTSSGGVTTVIMKYDHNTHSLSNGHDMGVLKYDHHIYKENGKYYLLGNNNQLYRADSIYGTWTLLRNGSEETEGQFAIKLDNGKWRIYRQELAGITGTAHIIYSDIDTLEEEIPQGIMVDYTDDALNYARNQTDNSEIVEYNHWTIFDFMNLNGNNNNYIN